MFEGANLVFRWFGLPIRSNLWTKTLLKTHACFIIELIFHSLHKEIQSELMHNEGLHSPNLYLGAKGETNSFPVLTLAQLTQCSSRLNYNKKLKESVSLPQWTMGISVSTQSFRMVTVTLKSHSSTQWFCVTLYVHFCHSS